MKSSGLYLYIYLCTAGVRMDYANLYQYIYTVCTVEECLWCR
jgi:hypothetical protein